MKLLLNVPGTGAAELEGSPEEFAQLFKLAGVTLPSGPNSKVAGKETVLAVVRGPDGGKKTTPGG